MRNVQYSEAEMALVSEAGEQRWLGPRVEQSCSDHAQQARPRYVSLWRTQNQQTRHP